MAQQTRHGNYGGARGLYGSFAGKSFDLVAVAPEDRDDQNAAGETLTFTSFTDCATGATLRAGRLTHWTAAESLRNADLNTPFRADPDRRESITDQIGRGTTRAVVHRIRISSNRAGEAWGSQAHEFEFSPDGDDQVRDAETTAQTDCATGASLMVPQLSIYTSTDSTRNADLGTPIAMTRDRYEQRALQIGNGTEYGILHRIRVTSNRAGDAWGSQAHVLEFSPEGDTELRGADI